ncbi:MAG: peptidoglycan bridge formation glycyltransferase FemA/FemB family protein [Candidatus Limnocylindrales bacterium]|jgi:lipid II:glycine glycyltransferase (peptidoglycan interpeptide bridge formation enzyme)
MVEQFMTPGARTPRAGVPAASVVDLVPETPIWDAFVARSNPGSYLQTSAWAEVKAPNGWRPVRLMGSSIVGVAGPATPEPPVSSAGAATVTPQATALPDPDAVEHEDAAAEAGIERETAFGVQLLLRRPRLFPWAFAYAPRGPILEEWNPATFEAFSGALQLTLASAPERVSHVRIEPEVELNGPSDQDGELRHALRRNGWRPGTPIQPPRTRKIDLRADEEALWGDLRSKWRQYVSKARRNGIRVVDAGVERLPEFYSIYQETARRAGFIIRTYDSYIAVWQAFAKLGMARLLMAETSQGKGVATLFVLRVGNRVIEPYGGMTAEGAESRANYLLKWEAIRTSRQQGAVSYDMWGLSHEGIEQFKSGFGGREIRYVGAWDLVFDPVGRLAFDGGQSVQDRIGRLRHGIRHVRGGRRGAEGRDMTGAAEGGV